MEANIRELKKRIQSENTPVYSATFNFRTKELDDDFECLNDAIDEAAHDSPGFLGKRWWQDPETNTQSVIYYWESREELQEFSRHPKHQKAKQQYERWYSGYEIIIAEVLSINVAGDI
ncbi:Heme-degrading monooxygenase HmoA [Fodinibius salinus]|uniref:Heme-degrading monooxygenase HmoA n=1 Tax=Fodinibius salinus TaxID=860790 RepID=A0A5D3YL75_9BACT|nr:DUF4188 domain-containing protein [Fodinibius salinus]TYP93441.1 Heme-degrading monooxygenase HmoA [Fodinibius salinus]